MGGPTRTYLLAVALVASVSGSACAQSLPDAQIAPPEAIVDRSYGTTDESVYVVNAFDFQPFAALQELHTIGLAR